MRMAIAGTGGPTDMLVFTRREGEEVVIGDPRNPIGVVRIATIRGDRVRIAFDFPKDVQVNRREIANQIADETTAAAAQGDGATPEIVAKIQPRATSGH
jgi:carbon storage regulator CsrA